MPSNKNAVPAGFRTVHLDGFRAIASDNPEVVAVIKGFLNGKPKSIALTWKMRDAGATVDVESGTVTLPIGKRGRRATPGLSQAELDDLLA
jgi:hypothetical protein